MDALGFRDGSERNLCRSGRAAEGAAVKGWCAVRFAVDINTVGTSHIDLHIKAEDEEHVRAIVANMLGADAAAQAFVREIAEPDPMLLRTQVF